jgi:VanZ family protein
MPLPRSFDRKPRVWHLLHWLPAAAVAVAIFVLSSFPDFGALEHPLLKESDKLLHGVVYALFAGCILWGQEKGFGQPVAGGRVWLAVILAAAYGITDEVHQRFVPGRMGTWQDWVADVVGALIGGWCIFVLTWLRSLRRV